MRGANYNATMRTRGSETEMRRDVLARLEIEGLQSGACTGDWLATKGEALVSVDPTTGEVLGTVRAATIADAEVVLARSSAAFESWRMRPAPLRGEVVRALGNALRDHKDDLGALISLEAGKIKSEGLGEVQEMIDICDFAVGLSRQLCGITTHSERPRHRMFEQWHPLGPIAIVTAFNFPMAVWAWNAALGAVCGDVMLWKPSPRTPLTALAVQQIANRVMREHDCLGVFNLLVGDADVGSWLGDNRGIPLVSFTGSTAVGRKVAATVAARLGRTILELGGNNAIIVMDDADLDMAVPSITFGAVGTAGQRCTSTRRIFAQRGVAAKLTERLVAAYRTITIGDPLAEGTLLGPLISQQAVVAYEAAIETAKGQGGTVLCGGKKVDRPGHFVEPTNVKAPAQADFPIAGEETCAPHLYGFEVDALDEAIAANNAVTQGLSSAIFTEGMRASEQFLSAIGSDCGIANVNIGTSGAEIGGAFGGEKDTGGGRESGSDSWKAYMRRQTCTVNWSGRAPLAQGVKFDVG